MFDFTPIALFAAASFALIIVPGPAVLYVITRSIEQGRSAGLTSVLAVSAGAYMQIIAAALGLSALVASSALAFSIIKYVGAAYLIYLGIQKFIAKPRSFDTPNIERQSLKKIFTEGLFVSILNPKSALFFLSFLPQFIRPELTSVTQQTLILGAIFVAIALISDGIYALLASSLGTWLRKSSVFSNVQHYLSGSIYMILGLGAALGSSSHSK